MIRTSSLRSAALAGVAIVALAACSSQPNPHSIVVDLIESADGPTPEQRTCMLERVDEYSSDEIEAIGDANKNIDFDNPEALAATTQEFQDFVEDLRTCM